MTTRDGWEATLGNGPEGSRERVDPVPDKNGEDRQDHGSLNDSPHDSPREGDLAAFRNRVNAEFTGGLGHPDSAQRLGEIAEETPETAEGLAERANAQFLAAQVYDGASRESEGARMVLRSSRSNELAYKAAGNDPQMRERIWNAQHGILNGWTQQARIERAINHADDWTETTEPPLRDAIEASRAKFTKWAPPENVPTHPEVAIAEIGNNLRNAAEVEARFRDAEAALGGHRYDYEARDGLDRTMNSMIWGRLYTEYATSKLIRGESSSARDAFGEAAQIFYELGQSGHYADALIGYANFTKEPSAIGHQREIASSAREWAKGSRSDPPELQSITADELP